MRALFAILLFAHVLSASTGEKAVASLDEATTVSLTDLCKASEVDYDAISAKMSEGLYDINGVIDCIKTFCESNNVEGLEAIHSAPGTVGKYSHFGLFHATKLGKVDAIKFYADRADIIADDFLDNATWAAGSGHLDAVRYFLSHEKFPHFGDSGFSVLLEAVTKGHPDIVGWILDEYMTLSQGQLYAAALKAYDSSYWDIIGVLIQHGFDINNDALGPYMPEIRDAYNAGMVRHAVTIEGAKEHLLNIEEIAKTIAGYGD